MKKLKIFGAIFCGIGALSGLINVTSVDAPPTSDIILLIALLAATAALMWSIVAEKRKLEKEQGAKYIMENADKYYESRKRTIDDYCAKQTSDADEYYNSQKEKADQYRAEQEQSAKAIREQIECDIADLRSQLQALQDKTIVELTQVDAYSGLKSDEIKNSLALLRVQQEEKIKSGTALIVTTQNTQKRVVDSQKKQILRCFNAETSNIISSVTVKNVDSSRAKIQRAFDAINKIFEVDGVQISQLYLAAKFEELSLVYAYMVKEEEEREQRKAIREQMAEEEKVRREIERKKQQIDKETAQFSNEVNKLMAYLQKSKDDVERNLYMSKINELQEKLKALEAERENAVQREQNARAGFVYVISNIGSFGEQVFKIGMTRRLDPMDRISELSSASVPFPFDVHAMIFSDDAPALEALLHQHFGSSRVNKVNQRKEFFKVDLKAIKKVVLENHNATVKFVDIPDAVEYRETLRLQQESNVGAAV